MNIEELKDEYDTLARQYMDILKYHVDTQKAVHLDTTVNLMEKLDNLLAALGEE